LEPIRINAKASKTAKVRREGSGQRNTRVPQESIFGETWPVLTLEALEALALQSG